MTDPRRALPAVGTLLDGPLVRALGDRIPHAVLANAARRVVDRARRDVTATPVDDDGCLTHTNDLPIEQQMPASLVGKSILEKHGKSDANEIVLHELRVRHALLHQENYHHSYPHCWRSKTPVIFRAMDQWFIKIDQPNEQSLAIAGTSSVVLNFTTQDPQVFEASWQKEKITGLRRSALNAIENVRWIPDWGKNRILSAVINRPDWCISRQRTWGVPIPAFYDAQGGEILHKDVICNVANLIEKHGSNIWFEKSAAELWALVKPANWSGAEAVAKSSDTLDVWIDSGSSSRAVIARREEIRGKEKSFQEIGRASCRERV